MPAKKQTTTDPKGTAGTQAETKPVNTPAKKSPTSAKSGPTASGATKSQTNSTKEEQGTAKDLLVVQPWHVFAVIVLFLVTIFYSRGEVQDLRTQMRETNSTLAHSRTSEEFLRRELSEIRAQLVACMKK